MKAIVQQKFGTPDALELRDVDVPAVTGNKVLVRVRAASVNALDWFQVTGTLISGGPAWACSVQSRRSPE